MRPTTLGDRRVFGASPDYRIAGTEERYRSSFDRVHAAR